MNWGGVIQQERLSSSGRSIQSYIFCPALGLTESHSDSSDLSTKGTVFVYVYVLGKGERGKKTNKNHSPVLKMTAADET